MPSWECQRSFNSNPHVGLDWVPITPQKIKRQNLATGTCHAYDIACCLGVMGHFEHFQKLFFSFFGGPFYGQV